MIPNTTVPRITSAFHVAIRSDGAINRVVATRHFSPGDCILAFDGEFVDSPSRYSIQVDAGLHLIPPRDLDPLDDSVQFAWRFLNHSCYPNAEVRGLRLVAIRNIASGEELTFDYNSTESVIAAPFRCQCGHCSGFIIRGAAFGIPSRGSAVHE